MHRINHQKSKPMKTIQSIFSLMLALLFSTVGFSQTIDLEVPSNRKPNKLSFTVSQGHSISSTGNDLLQGMKESGLNNSTPVEHHIIIFGPINLSYDSGGETYPEKTESNAYTHFQVRYDLTPKSAVAFNTISSTTATVKGHDRKLNSSN